MREHSITITMVTYQRHAELKRAIASVLSQTDRRWILDIRNDGPDPIKHAFVEAYNDPRIQYTETSSRANLFGANLRVDGITACNTEYWCTTNDDNVYSPHFIKQIMDSFESPNKPHVVRFSIGMANWTRIVKRGIRYEEEKRLYESALRSLALGSKSSDIVCFIPILGPNEDRINRVDACSFVIQTDIIGRVGWQIVGKPGEKVTDDWKTYEGILKLTHNISRLENVLAIHA